MRRHRAWLAAHIDQVECCMLLTITATLFVLCLFIFLVLLPRQMATIPLPLS